MKKHPGDPIFAGALAEVGVLEVQTAEVGAETMLDGLFAIKGANHVMALSLQPLVQDIDQITVIINHQDFHVGFSYPSLCERHAVCVSGNESSLRTRAFGQMQHL